MKNFSFYKQLDSMNCGLTWIIYILLTFSFCFGCKNTSHSNLTERIANYHLFVNQAENNIICNRFKEAEDKYRMSRIEKKEPFPIDIYNRMVCNHQFRNSDVIFENAKLMVILTGVSLDKIQEKYRFLLLYPDEWTAFKEWYPTGKKEFVNNLSANLQNELLHLQEMDQEFSKHSLSSTLSH